METAPILLFTYNRPKHTCQTIEALQNNYGASKSTLYIFSDGPKTLTNESSVSEVRSYIKSIDGFQNIKIVERDLNWGLAENIIHSVTDVVSEYGRVIVLEDDIVTSPYFLTYMNDALDYYKDRKQVMHISGWNYPVNPEGLPETFLWRVMNCWGWATWADRWHYFTRDLEGIIDSFSNNDIHRFNLDGTYNFWSQIISNRENKINTWAIFWYATILKNKGLCLNPSISLTKNIGLDESGMHCGFGAYPGQSLYEKKVTYFPDVIKENIDAVEAVKAYLNRCKKPLWKKAVKRVRKIFSVKRGV